MKLNKMTVIAVLALGSLLTLGTALNAQDATSNAPAATLPAVRGRPNFEAIAKQLELTDDQKPKAKAVIDAQQKQMRELRGDTSLSQEDRRAKGKTIRDEATAKLKEILTPEQFAKYQKMTSGRRPAAPAPAATPQ